MRKHTRLFMAHYGYGEQDYIPCALCGGRAVDLHHIDPKGIGGSAGKDVIENIIPVCRYHHGLAERGVLKPEQLRARVKELLENAKHDSLARQRQYLSMLLLGMD